MIRLIIFLASIVSATAFAYPYYGQHWPHRSVIYFAPSQDEHVAQFELETLLNDCALSSRDIVTLVITQDGYTQPEWVEQQFDLGALFNLYRVNPDEHTAILIGKDGTEKLRWGKSTDWPMVKQTVDAMPMRQQEMQNKQDPCSI
ncbi:DUF4174 domain-containing protein [Vibrio panuliri]|uniref:DUF4174 domain-containing protein n=1 Tax=Vibrio panuliri TaxID=1381081 RepID=A0A1Q9HFP8_9VIBR|nr:DUF4174 domain-containing protein [Vibrio panuliri]KAB1457176.1 DUF4174 domain-containing protein [Vibrio panuliri]OLQ86848.1 hypothetical protein BIY20_14515 [Vibrio panuliri]OLQ88595.1 hypothetical protein BIY22_21000 [Vibrio panuliri]